MDEDLLEVANYGTTYGLRKRGVTVLKVTNNQEANSHSENLSLVVPNHGDNFFAKIALGT